MVQMLSRISSYPKKGFVSFYMETFLPLPDIFVDENTVAHGDE